MGEVTVRARKVYSGADADKAAITGEVGDLYHASDTGIKYFWNGALSSWDNGHKQRIRNLGRGVTDIGVIAPVAWTRFGSALFLGSNLEGIPTNLKFYLQTTGAGTVTVRLQDITNALTVGSIAGLSGAKALYDLGALTNIPTGSAELELQVLPSGGGITVVICCISLLYD